MQQIDQRQMLPVGTLLDNRYRIVRYLASGGFGNTYVADDTRMGGQVAVKEFFMRGTNHRLENGTTVEVSNSDNQDVFEVQLEKFKREASRIFKLRNDHIIHVFDLFDANGTSYYVMDLVKGVSLSQQVRQQPLPEDEAREVILQVLDALKAMHAEGLYHLDVKPGNIMRSADGHCTLIDFGASKQLTSDERNTLSSSVMAYTPGYAPIEQIAQQTKNIGPWTDFFALGATYYCLLTGKRPPEVDAEDMAPEGRNFPYPPTVGSQARRAVSAMMNAARSLRPQNADQVRALLSEPGIPPIPKVVEPASQEDEKTTLEPPPPPPPASIAAAEETHYQPEEIYEEEASGRGKWYAVIAVLALALLGAGAWLLKPGDGESSEPLEDHREILSDAGKPEKDSTSGKEEVMPPAKPEEETEKSARDKDESAQKEEMRKKEEAARKEEMQKKEEAARKEEMRKKEEAARKEELKKKEEAARKEAERATPAKPAETKRDDHVVYDVADQMPSFPGGAGELNKWLSTNIHYPPVAVENGIQGRVIVSFVVEPDGSISNATVSRGVDPSLNQEALRVVRSMPRWQPGMKDGRKVRVKYNLPISFRL